jgi:hypothetical protein
MAGMDVAAHYIADTTDNFNKMKAFADRAFAQISDDEFFRAIDGESNSIAIITRHLAGNLRSRFTDFLTSDGEKPDRNRDAEFEMPEGLSREAIIAAWELGFRTLNTALRELTPADLMRDVTIGGTPHTVIQALNRAAIHLANHVGQIVMLAKHYRGAEWRTLTIPRGQSARFTGFKP